MAYFALLVGLWFTAVTRGIQFRRFKQMFREIMAPPAETDGVRPLQAVLLTLSSRIGVGNIAGVATAIYAGGPGAMFWMVVVALLGSASAYAEVLLSQTFKRRLGGEDRGGAPFYVQAALKLRWLAVIIACCYLVCYGFLTTGVQASTITASAENAFGVPAWGTAVVLTILMGFTIFGGTARIMQVAQVMVPVMALCYIAMLLILMGMNIDQIVPSIQLVLGSAFGQDEIFGGLAGAAIAWGVRRATFSNVAGVGEGTFASASASNTHPSKQGLIQSFSIFIDTVVVCQVTGIMILITNSYNVSQGDDMLVEYLPGLEAGVSYTQEAINTGMPGFGPAFVALGIFFFALTSMVAYYYIAETNLFFIMGRADGIARLVLRLGALGITIFGCLGSGDIMWALGDISFGLLGWINMLVILSLTPIVIRVTKDYDSQLRAGKDPIFRPRDLGIDNADWWEDFHARRTAVAER
ncbi:alanine/glycine:cation symporter family protein [Corynebacterium hadale]|nr:alanine/glycine:cation symporter family protein [Corynebacterium hadale]